MIWPEEVDSSPAIMRNSVVLPAARTGVSVLLHMAEGMSPCRLGPAAGGACPFTAKQRAEHGVAAAQALSRQDPCQAHVQLAHREPTRNLAAAQPTMGS